MDVRTGRGDIAASPEETKIRAELAETADYYSDKNNLLTKPEWLSEQFSQNGSVLCLQLQK